MDPGAIAQLLMDAAEADSRARYLLALAYSDAYGVEKNEEESNRLLESAAVDGDSNAQCTLGFMYALGESVGKDLKLAALWLERASSHGNKIARRALRAMRERPETCIVESPTPGVAYHGQTHGFPYR